MVLAKRAPRTDHVTFVPLSVSSNITGDFRSRNVLLIFLFYHNDYDYSLISWGSACSGWALYFTMPDMNGLHCLVDVTRCTKNAFLTDVAPWCEAVAAALAKHGFTQVGFAMHAFSGTTSQDGAQEQCGFTCTWLLAESHIALHTWPETQSYTLDAYVCNYSNNNENAVRVLVSDLLFASGAKEHHVQWAWRGARPLVIDNHGSEQGIWYRGERELAVNSAYQFIEIWNTKEFGKILKMDGIVMSTQRDEAFYHEPLVHVPMLLSKKAVNVVVLGGGDGGSIREALKHSEVERVDVFELDWSVVETTKQRMPWLDAGAWTDPRVHLEIDDALVLLSQYVSTGRRADALILDLTDPDPRSSPLYGQAAMARYQSALSEHGVLSLHLGLGLAENDKSRISSTLMALKSIFPHVQVYWTVVPSYGGFWLMAVASMQPLVWTGHKERLAGLGSLRWLSHGMLSIATTLPPVVEALLQANTLSSR